MRSLNFGFSLRHFQRGIGSHSHLAPEDVPYEFDELTMVLEQMKKNESKRSDEKGADGLKEDDLFVIPQTCYREEVSYFTTLSPRSEASSKMDPVPNDQLHDILNEVSVPVTVEDDDEEKKDKLPPPVSVTVAPSVEPDESPVEDSLPVGEPVPEDLHVAVPVTEPDTDLEE